MIDLADPAHPWVLGQVELPGFSEYLHPRGEIDHQSLAAEACPGSPYDPCLTLVQMKRGIFIDDWI